MTAALIVSSLIAIISAFRLGFTELLLLRILQGVACRAARDSHDIYLSEEIEPASLGMRWAFI